MKCKLPGCPCLDNWRDHPGRTPWAREVVADDMDVENVLSRIDEAEVSAAGLSWHDRYRVFLVMQQEGYSARRTALTVGCTPRTIVRWRRKLEEAEV
jgi:hypothetical protein